MANSELMNNYGIELVKKLKPAVFKYYDKDKLHLGIIAQDIDEVLPEQEYGILTRDKNGFLMVHYHELICPLIKAVQELSNKVDILEGELKRLKEIKHG